MHLHNYCIVQDLEQNASFKKYSHTMYLQQMPLDYITADLLADRKAISKVWNKFVLFNNLGVLRKEEKSHEAKKIRKFINSRQQGEYVDSGLFFNESEKRNILFVSNSLSFFYISVGDSAIEQYSLLWLFKKIYSLYGRVDWEVMFLKSRKVLACLIFFAFLPTVRDCVVQSTAACIVVNWEEAF